eukprot:28320-Eustigmatos_ZCMA.PRE.1
MFPSLWSSARTSLAVDPHPPCTSLCPSHATHSTCRMRTFTLSSGLLAAHSHTTVRAHEAT